MKILLTRAGLVTTVMRVILVCITAKYFAIALPFALVSVYLIQRYYLRTSRQLRLLDIEAKAPLYSQFIETLGGLATIRAFGWQHALQRRNHELLDTSQKPFYLLACIQVRILDPSQCFNDRYSLEQLLYSSERILILVTLPRRINADSEILNSYG